MSSRLWKAYYEDDVNTFRQLLLQNSVYNTRLSAGRGSNAGPVLGSPEQYGTSPGFAVKSRKSGGRADGATLTKADINWRDSCGRTLLHLVASTTTENALYFATALIEHAHIDLYVQDLENGWTALHRAFYFGNIAIARLILERDAGDALGRTTGHVHQTIGLVKIKDREGHGPLDLYAATIKDRTLRPEQTNRPRSGSNASDEERPSMVGDGDDVYRTSQIFVHSVNGDQVFTFGSNQNVSLGFGDQDDRHFPERITLRRPEHLVRRFHSEHVAETAKKWSAHDPSFVTSPVAPASGWLDDLPFVVRSKPIIIREVQMAKLSSAVLTDDPEANLYMCGHGQSGRLGTGDEQTRFNFVCVEGGSLAGKRVVSVALGQGHTLALSEEGETFSWGNNGFGQLGYTLPKAAADDKDPCSTFPRQIYGVLKRETVTGIAASRVHSVAYTPSSLFTFGKNEGQLGIMDSDARSLEMQTTPRKVAASLFSFPIEAVCAIDKATVCLLESHEVFVFANYGYARVQFPLDTFSNYFLKQSFLLTNYDSVPNRIVKLTGGGDTICAMSSRGEIYTFSISQRLDNQITASTTNPAKIRSAITQPQRIWSPRKTSMAARDVGVDADGAIIVSTEEGSVWKRIKRAHLKDATASGTGEYKPKDYKFSRIPGLTRVLAVRASAYGAYAAIRQDCDVLRTQIVVEDQHLRTELLPLLSLKLLVDGQRHDSDDDRPRFWQGSKKMDEVQVLKQAILDSKDIEQDLLNLVKHGMGGNPNSYDAIISSSASDVTIPVNRFMLTGRSKVLRRGFRDLCETSTFTVSDLAVSELDKDGRAVIKFQGLDSLTLVNFVVYLYTDSFIDFWHLPRAGPMTFRYRQVRNELMKVASKLDMAKLEQAVRQMVGPKPCLDLDLEVAFADPAFFYDGDIAIQLEDDQVRAHSALLCARCPFFDGLFMGRAGGRWLTGRAEDALTVDLSHISSRTFRLVLRHIYADTGTELFDDIVSIGVDDFLDTVVDVMSAANELMLDRLSQICQYAVGRYVNVRNVSELLNAISPSSVREFKDAALEYMCLNMEAMLQGHHFNALDEELLTELDVVVRENQLACMPFAKSDRPERLLYERHPELAAAMDKTRQRRIDAAAVRARHQDLDNFVPGSFGEDILSSPVLQARSRRRSSTVQHRADAERPSLKGKTSTKDMMFAMDEEGQSDIATPEPSPAIRPMTSPRGLEPIASSPPEEVWYDSRGKALPSPQLKPQTSIPGAITPRTPKSPTVGGKTPPSNSAVPWSLTPLPGPRTDLRNIMAQTASTRTSYLSQSLAAAMPPLPETPSSFSLGPSRVSQKDRKRMQQNQHPPSVAQVENKPSEATPPAALRPAGSPWQTPPTQRSPALRPALHEKSPNEPLKPVNARGLSTPQLTMRQTVANTKPGQSPVLKTPVLGPTGSSALQQRSVSDSKAVPTIETARPASSHRPLPRQPSNSKPIPQSIRHQAPVEQILGLSMSEIVAQEQAAKDEVKAAVAKRDLSEIQAEQEFQEWWNKESARVQEAERKSAAAAAKTSKRRHGRGGAKGGKGKTGVAGERLASTSDVA
ncbi:hypothetical protein BAUCODRAFT_30128 [Baudoinia panamericana UAMH 10762]|uniref:BTB domain-containing protein n=1 Tax=Baudoinia panamericana (strain UAMH 10762) TaxID=717646 RepID=M2NJX8_BAUPA|nr:uncharacterized protein BAUCODRAFT_30128 [Baudoinia panamericana UAMH 10762]EMC99734.1 hypothetical protein BAUCODRAFT_30128 [Baudoinia panamericana UAMH 10762]